MKCDSMTNKLHKDIINYLNKNNILLNDDIKQGMSKVIYYHKALAYSNGYRKGYEYGMVVGAINRDKYLKTLEFKKKVIDKINKGE
jgi:hypothetical protein